MKILLIGIGGVYNYGCEGIVRGTVALLKEKLPQASVFYASLDFDRDQKALTDLNIQIIDVSLKKFPFRRIYNGIRRRIGMGNAFGPWNLSLLPQCDIAFSIGGDIYTIDANTNPNSYSHPLVEVGEYLISKDVKYVLWGASVGPFSKFPEIESYFHNHLKNCTLVFARETITKNYLDQLSGINVVEVADPAFFMEPADHVVKVLEKTEKIRIGLNLSRLSIAQRYPKNEWMQQESRIIESIIALAAIPNTEILLIPHVQPDDKSMDDDYEFLSYIQKLLEQENIKLLPSGLGAPQTKRIIADCDVLIAARMHCAIAGSSIGVPTIFLAYSPKAVGMAEYIYGDKRYCLDLDEINSAQLVDKVNEILNNKNEISAYLKDRLHIWKAKALVAADSLIKILV
jgi:polysaccharide pyruvyl transferase WcaK-like protein